MSPFDFTTSVIFLMAFSFSFYYYLQQELSRAERVVWRSNLTQGYSGRGQYLPNGWATSAVQCANLRYFGQITHWTEKRPLFRRIAIAFLLSFSFSYIYMFVLGFTLLFLFAYLR